MMSFTHPRREQIWLMCFHRKGFVWSVSALTRRELSALSASTRCQTARASTCVISFMISRIQNSFPPHC